MPLTLSPAPKSKTVLFAGYVSFRRHLQLYFWAALLLRPLGIWPTLNRNCTRSKDSCFSTGSRWLAAQSSQITSVAGKEHWVQLTKMGAFSSRQTEPLEHTNGNIDFHFRGGRGRVLCAVSVHTASFDLSRSYTALKLQSMVIFVAVDAGEIAALCAVHALSFTCSFTPFSKYWLLPEIGANTRMSNVTL